VGDINDDECKRSEYKGEDLAYEAGTFKENLEEHQCGWSQAPTRTGGTTRSKRTELKCGPYVPNLTAGTAPRGWVDGDPGQAKPGRDICAATSPRLVLALAPFTAGPWLQMPAEHWRWLAAGGRRGQGGASETPLGSANGTESMVGACGGGGELSRRPAKWTAETRRRSGVATPGSISSVQSAL
jgi:hypothetical protein